MRTRNVAVAALVVLGLVVPRASQMPPMEPRVSNGRWSAAVNGLRGRLILTAFEAGPRQQLRIDLEIENVRDVLGPIEIPWRTRPYLLATLEPKTPDARDHPRPWVGPLVLPPSSYPRWNPPVVHSRRRHACPLNHTPATGLG